MAGKYSMARAAVQFTWQGIGGNLGDQLAYGCSVVQDPDAGEIDVCGRPPQIIFLASILPYAAGWFGRIAG
ncbi:MAG TPA: hypothetical protein VHJ18_31015 [Streptosporangiaceae bacterium]|nr:hypothetical protein [Streptosporangiaceae bacterium]